VPTSRWDRPPPPHDWRWVVGTIGKVLIATGLLMFGFVAYQLWGTAIEYRQSQDRLAGDFAQLLETAGPTTSAAAAPTTTAPVATTGPGSIPAPTTVESTTVESTTVESTTVAPSTVAPSTTAVPVSVPDFSNGDVMALLQIPTIGVTSYVVSGVEPGDLKQGPGHYPDTPMPGQLGNSAIAGHRTTYGQPFYRLDELAVGDQIIATTVQGRFVYRVTGSQVVSPSDSQVVATTDPTVATLTLTTCTPRYTAAKRLIVSADFDPAASAAVQAPIIPPPSSVPGTLPGGPTDDPVVTTAGPAVTTATVVGGGAPAPTGPGSAPTTTVARASGEPTGATADAFAHGWFDDRSAFGQVALWGLVLTAVSIGAWLLSRRVRRNWVGALVGIVPFVIALYFFFQNVNRLLPAAL
jgi:sortase A